MNRQRRSSGCEPQQHQRPATLGGRLVGLAALAAMAATGCAQLGAPKETAAAAAAREKAAATKTFVYVGLANGEIAAFELNTSSGGLTRRAGAALGRAPSALAGSDERQVLIATDDGGTAIALAVNPKTGALTTVGRAATGGSHPSDVTVDRSGKYALVANSGSANAAVLAIKPNGSLDAGDAFPAGAGANAIAVHPSNEVAFVANLRAGTVSQFSFNTGTGTLTPKRGPPLGMPSGAGPTRFACHPSGRWVYILNEAQDSISVHVFDEDIRALSVLASQTISTLPDDRAAKKNRPGDLRLGPAGHFLYASNRGHDSVATFAVDATGTLTLVSHQPSGGKTPDALATDPGGAFLFVANNGSRNLAVFRLDEKSGAPSQLSTVALAAAPQAVVAVRFDPDGP